MACFNTAICKMVQLLTGPATSLAALTHQWLCTLTGTIHDLVHISIPLLLELNYLLYLNDVAGTSEGSKIKEQ